MSWEDVMGGLTKKRKREEEMEGEIGDLATENALLKAEVKKLKSEKKSLLEVVLGVLEVVLGGDMICISLF